MRRAYIDFEFSGSNEEIMHVVCVSYYLFFDGEEKIETIWLLDPTERARFLDILKYWQEESVTLVAFYAIAEARSILSLGVDPRKFKWIDLWIEYRMLLNHNHEFECGKQLINGVVKYIKPPKPKWDQEDGYSTGGKAEISLAACTYKMLGIQRDTKHKDDMRDLILSKKEFNDFEQIDIMDYCEEDIVHLPKLHEAIYKALYKLYEPEDRKNLKQEIYLRGDYAVATALMEKKGYSIDYVATKSFSDSVPDIIFQMQKEVNEEFPDVGAFLCSVKGDKFTQKQKNIQKWISDQKIKDWTLTEKGSLSLSLDAFEEHFSHKQDMSIFGNRFVKYLRDKQSLNGFTANTEKRNLWSYVGSDQRVRPHFGIYVAQSSRSQPSATGYIPLKSSWMRVLLNAPKGKCIVSIDYGQQEFLLAALLSEDKQMIAAYHSGDPYLYTAKLAKAIPMDATKDSHAPMRDKFKSTCLAKGTLIRVKDFGYLPIEEITDKHLVWDGEGWRRTRGAKHMGWKDVITVEGVAATRDHLVLTTEGWKQYGDTEKIQRKGKVYFKNASRLQKPSASWAEIWRMACYILQGKYRRTQSKNTL